jgi:hypothetical protein
MCVHYILVCGFMFGAVLSSGRQNVPCRFVKWRWCGSGIFGEVVGQGGVVVFSGFAHVAVGLCQLSCTIVLFAFIWCSVALRSSSLFFYAGNYVVQGELIL